MWGAPRSAPTARRKIKRWRVGRARTSGGGSRGRENPRKFIGPILFDVQRQGVGQESFEHFGRLLWRRGAIQAIAVHRAEKAFEPFHLVHQLAPGEGGSFHQMKEDTMENSGGNKKKTKGGRRKLRQKKQSQGFAAQEGDGEKSEVEGFAAAHKCGIAAASDFPPGCNHAEDP